MIIFSGTAGTERSGIEFCLGQEFKQFQSLHCWLEAASILAGNTNAWLLVLAGFHPKQEIATAALGLLL